MSISSVFISHSSNRNDYQFAKGLALCLEERGFKVWWDQKRLRAGDSFAPEILEAILHHHFFLYIMSPKSVASKWCNRELIFADELGKEIKPLLLEEVPVDKQPLVVKGLLYVNVGQGVSKSLPKILYAMGLGMHSEVEIVEEPYARDGRLVQTIASQLNYAKTFTDTLNLVLLLKTIGESCCETDRARRLFEQMLVRAKHPSGRIDYDRVRDYLLQNWNAS